MSLQKYLHTIKDIDPGKIFVENVRSVYKIPQFAARVLCEMAVQDKLFEKKIGLICPAPTCNKRIIAEFNSFDELPDEVACAVCEGEGLDQFIYKTSELEKIEFYRLIK